jgi:hypothetical protein
LNFSLIYTWSAGYDTYIREAIVKDIYHSSDLVFICDIVRREHIAIVEVNRSPEGFLQPVNPFWYDGHLTPLYKNPQSGLTLYETHTICK